VSPILVRPVREQLEHDRVIRLLPGRYKRRFEVGINPGPEQNAAIGTGTSAVYPDAVLYSTEKTRKIQGVVEVENVESINHLEVMSQWGPYSRLKVPFHLYVPVAALDVARRLSSDHETQREVWSRAIRRRRSKPSAGWSAIFPRACGSGRRGRSGSRSPYG